MTTGFLLTGIYYRPNIRRKTVDPLVSKSLQKKEIRGQVCSNPVRVTNLTH